MYYSIKDYKLNLSHPISELDLSKAPWLSMKPLLDECYPRPPKDVFGRVVTLSHERQRLWLAFDGSTITGMVMLSPHSKGGHLENLAVDPRYRGKGIAKDLVMKLMDSMDQTSSFLISLTTRIPGFFEPFGFTKYDRPLKDGSTVMIFLSL